MRKIGEDNTKRGVTHKQAPPQDSWNGELLGYVATWRELGGAGGGRAGARGWSCAELTLGGLRTFARYALSVRAYNRAGAGPHSPTVYATTADGGLCLYTCYDILNRNECRGPSTSPLCTVPEEAPGSVRCEPLSARSVRVRWSPLSAAHAHALRGYDLHYAPLHFSSCKYIGEVTFCHYLLKTRCVTIR